MKIRNPFLIRQISRTIALCGRGLFSTVRVEALVAKPATSPHDPQNTNCQIYCAWHDCIAALLFTGRCVKMSGLTSRHADGSFVSEVMSAMKIHSVRGSSRHGGASALAELLEAAKKWDIAITPDGPRGPRRQLKEGVIFLASNTGLPIIPITFACKSAWRPQGKWTDLVIPKPLSRAWLLGGLPISVPAGLSREQVREYREMVQARMDEQQAFCDALALGESATPPVGFETGAYRSCEETHTSWEQLGVKIDEHHTGHTHPRLWQPTEEEAA